MTNIESLRSKVVTYKDIESAADNRFGGFVYEDAAWLASVNTTEGFKSYIESILPSYLKVVEYGSTKIVDAYVKLNNGIRINGNDSCYRI